MALDTRDNLISSVQDTLNRSDLDSVVPDWIEMAEAEFNRVLRIRQMYARATATASTQFVSLPTDFLEMRNIQIDSSPPFALEYLTPERMDDIRYDNNNPTGKPFYYTIQGSTVELYKTPDTSYTLQIGYFQKVDALSASNTSNFILDNWPDLYLYQTLTHSSPYLMEDERTPVWETRASKIMGELMIQDENTKYSGSTVKMRPRNFYV
tara:strand:- start:1135 stop:1761 length:627 start_codon:yes stop_codon:yes gene_type:complete